MKITIIEKLNEDFTLLKRDTECQPWVIAYDYNEDNKTWSYGNYFSTLLNAMKWFDKKGRL